MTPAQEKYKKNLIKYIHSNKKNVFINDEQRKEFMLSRFNCSSLKLMSIDKLEQLLKFCKGELKDIPLVEPITSAQMKKINDLWQEKARDTSDTALCSFTERITNKSFVNILTKSEATKLIIAIDKMV